VTSGTFQVYVGASSRDLRLTNSFTVTSVPSSDLANAALHQAVTASSTLNTDGSAAAAVDGNPASAWNSLPGNRQWLAVDLGMIKDLSRVRLQWGIHFAVRYALEISPDAKHWQTIFKTKQGAGGVEDLLVSGRARYVRMQATRSSSPGAGYALNEFEVYSQPQKPFGGSVPILPGRIEAENFDTGGENVAYHKSTVGNRGGVYRTNDDVGIEPATDTGGGYSVILINPGDWLEYTVNVPDPSAIYRVSVRVASPFVGWKLRIRLDGKILGTVTIPNTGGWHSGGWQNWQTIALPNVPIAGGIGSRALRLEVLEGGFNLNWIELDRVQVCSTKNLALNQPATASSVTASNVAAKAFDGDPRSLWSSQTGNPQWLSVDLGSVQDIARVRLDWESGDWKDSGYGHAAYSRSFSLQFSTDGQTWTNAYATTNSIGGVNDLAVSGRARYVRMNSTQAVNAKGVALYEFEIYAPTSSEGNQSK
jgi:hypothetical protein